MANQQSAKGPEPRDGAFDDPAMTIGAQSAAVLIGPVHPILPIGTGEDDPADRELFPERVTIVAPVAEQLFGIAAVRRYARAERCVDETDFRGRRRSNGDSQRKTLTLDQYHAL